MASVAPFAKYLTIEQLMVYAEVFETLIQRKQRMVDAVDALSRLDARRDRSSVLKTIRSLNEKMLATQVGTELLSRNDGNSEMWTATNAGYEFYEFARSVRTLVGPLDEFIARHVHEEKKTTVGVRRTMVRIFNQIVPVDLQKDIDIPRFSDKSFKHWLVEGGCDVVFDELFSNEKSSISQRDYYYWQFSHENIVIVTNPRNASFDLGFEPDDGTGKKRIQTTKIPKTIFVIPRNALYMRLAASIANARLDEVEFVSRENERILNEYYPLARFVEGGLTENFADQLMSISEGYAVIVPDSDCDKIDDLMGIKHQRIEVLHGDRNLYFNHVAFVTRPTKNNPPSIALEQLEAIFDATASPAKNLLRVKAGDIDYSVTAFACANCSNRLPYVSSENEYVYRAVCDECLWVTEFNSEDNTTRVVFEAKEINYTDQFDAGEFSCVCGNVFGPVKKVSKRGHPYFYCDSCFRVYQQIGTKATTLYRKCGAQNCDVEHSFRVSSVKRIDESSCYNSMMRLEYNANTDTVKMKGPLNVKVVKLPNIQRRNVFACPHFSCGKTASRPAILNARGEAYSHCTYCGNDIRLSPSEA